MKISGFTFVKNATKLYFPVRQSILSVLPMVDEFVVALGKSDDDDDTLAEIQRINSDKIKIVHVEWDTEKYPKNTIFAQQTDLAKEVCTGDWLFYMQSDEAIHEQWLPQLKELCETYLDDKRVDGFLFQYKHFWGDYKHFHKNHVWYPKEIRLIRNDKKIHSWKDAQSFRKFETFDYSYENYMSKAGKKLNVVEVPAEIFHYGYVRPPRVMGKKTKSNIETFSGKENAEEFYKKSAYFDYGPMDKLHVFNEEHPTVMQDWIDDFHWQEDLRLSGSVTGEHRHDRLKYRIISWFENHVFGKQLWGFRNYNIIKSVKF